MTLNSKDTASVSKITEKEFYAMFDFIDNHIDNNASLDGFMFETYGKELDFVLAQNPNHIWTYQDNDKGDPCFTSGYHIVNRIGYLISKQPWTENFYVPLETDGVN